MIDQFNIRPCELQDEPAVVALWQTVLPSNQPWNEPRRAFHRKLRAADGLFYVGECDDQIVATLAAGYDGVRGWGYSLAVHPDFRRRGFARRIVDETEKRLHARGCPKINLQVRGDNRRVVGFFEKLGYRVEDRVSLGKPLEGDKDSSIADPVPTLKVDEAIEISQITWADKTAYLEHLNDSDVFHRNMGLIPYPYTDQDAEAWLLRVTNETLAGDKSRSWAIRNAAGGLIGGCGLHGIDNGEKAEVGYWLSKPHWGRGITTRCVRAACEFGFREYGLQRIYARVFEFNVASARVLEKAGFALEGVLRKHHFREGWGIDVRMYGRLREE